MTMAYSFKMHKSALPFQRNRLRQIALGFVVLIFLCVDICEPSGDENNETVPTIMTAVNTSTAVNPRVQTPTSKPISTPRLGDGISSRLSPTYGLTDRSSTRRHSKGIPNVGPGSWTFDTNQLGKFSKSGKVDKSTLHTRTDPVETTITKTSESLYSKNEKTSWPDQRTTSKPVASAPVLSSPEPSRSVKTLALSPTPNIGIGTIKGGNNPSVSSPFTGSIVARETISRPSPSYIDPNVLSTSGAGPRTPHVKGTRTPTYRIQTLAPTPTPYPTVAHPHKCPLGKGSKQECICMNCEGNTAPGLLCCLDQLYPKDMDQGVVIVISSLSMMGFLPKIESLRKLAGQIVNEECSKIGCFEDSVVRKKRSAKDWNEYGTPIKSWDGSPITPTNSLKPNSRRNAASTAPRIQKPIDVSIVMFKISQHPSQQRDLYTAFYASVDGTNETQIIKADVLERLIRSKKSRLEQGLNITIDRVAPWDNFRRIYSIGPRAVSSTAALPSSSVILPGGGTPSIKGQEGRNSTANMSKSTFIIVLVLGIGGFVVLAIIIIYMLVKFLRRMKGEFVPDKAYPNEQKSEAGSDQLIPSFIDPSTPRITDVPKKTVRPAATPNASGVSGSGGGGSGGTAGGGSGGTKKAKKPMGVKVTYKPPKWD